MKFIDTVERKFLFSITRAVAITFIGLLVLAIVAGGFLVRGRLTGETTKVNPSEVMEVLSPASNSTAGESVADAPTPKTNQNMLPGIKLPFALQKHLSSPENIRILNGWLTALPRDQRQQFVEEMAATVGEAEKRQLDASNAMNKFNEIKTQKIADAKVAASILEQQRIYYAAAAFSAILLVVLLSLILVLLAIERNTRKD